MTHRERIEILKNTICFLYEKEGRSKSYISRLLEVDRKTLISAINEWGIVQANISRLLPSNQKFINKHRNFIKSKLDKDISITDIAKELSVERSYLSKIIKKDDVLKHSNLCYLDRISKNAKLRKDKLKEESTYEYDISDVEGEVWKDVLGYEGYMVSNMGRIKSYVKTYKDYKLVAQNVNNRSGRAYASLDGKTLQVSRIVGFSFVDGYSEINNTIDHIDGNPLNNKACNLEWVCQSENNKRAYELGRSINVAYQRNGKFKKIIVDEEYEFKTIVSMAKFLGVSESQAHRYISNECRCNHEIKFIY